MTDDLFLRCVMRAVFDLPTPVREVDPSPSIAAVASEADATLRPIIVQPPPASSATPPGFAEEQWPCAPPPTLH
jgi:hypothetical protein